MASRIMRPCIWRSSLRLIRGNVGLPQRRRSSLVGLAKPGSFQNFRRHASLVLATSTSEKDEEKPIQGLRLRLDLDSEQLIEDHRAALRDVLDSASTVPEATHQDLSIIQSEIARLGDGFFMLVVAGEYNSGKSSLVNALLGRDVLAEGPTPTTSEITKLKYGENSLEPSVDENGILVLAEPVQVLSNRLQIVDTPGTNAIDRGHETLTRQFLPLCDIVLFVTSADRPFSESERLFLESIRKWGKKVVLVVNKVDLLESTDAKEEVLRFVSSSARSLLGKDSKVFALSARQAKEAKLSSDGAVNHWHASGMETLEHYINDTLDSEERLRLKLRASASIGRALAEKYIAVLSANQAVVDADRKTIDEIEGILRRHEDGVRNGYPAHFARADVVLSHAVDRADHFFDTHIRIANYWTLSDRAATKHAFEESVVKGTTKSVKRQIQTIAEWLADVSSRNLADAAASYSRRIGERSREIDLLRRKANIESDASSITFAGPSKWNLELSGAHEKLVSGLNDVTDELVDQFPSREDGTRIADKVASNVRMSAALGIGSVGCLTASLLNSSFSLPLLTEEPSLALLAGCLGAISTSIVPRCRSILRGEIRAKISNARRRLERELQVRQEEQLVAHLANVRNAMVPFCDFCDGEAAALRGKLSALSNSLDSVQRLEDKLSTADTESQSTTTSHRTVSR